VVVESGGDRGGVMGVALTFPVAHADPGLEGPGPVGPVGVAALDLGGDTHHEVLGGANKRHLTVVDDGQGVIGEL
jgi:hypothetical protein